MCEREDIDVGTTNVLSLCAGGGGLDIGVELAVPTARTVAYVEIEAYACAVLAARMEEASLAPAPLWTNLKTFDGRPWRGVVDLLIGGYPCQPFSVAGKQRGAADPRHLWPFIGGQRPDGEDNIITQLGYPDCFFENVANHLRVGFQEVHADLCRMGYRVATGLFTAEEVGATHRRERLFIFAKHLANSSNRLFPQPQRGSEGRNGSGSTGQIRTVGYADEQGLEGRGPESERPDQGLAFPPGPSEYDHWRAVLGRDALLAPATTAEAIESYLRRMADGMAPRLDRLRLLGNGVVPLEAAYAFTTLTEALS